MKEQTELRKFRFANKVLWFLYRLLGGIYVSKSTPIRIKRTWILINLLNIFTFMFAALVYYIIVHINKPITVFDFLLLTINVSIVFQIVIFIPLITICFRSKLKAILEYIRDSKESQTPLFCEEILSIPLAELEGYTFLKKIDPVTPPLILLALTTGLCSLYSATPVFEASFFYDEGVPQSLQYHPLAVPFYDRITSLFVYYTFCVGELLLATTLNIAGSIHPTFFLIMSRLLSNIIVDYCEKIRRLSQIVTLKIEGNLMSESPYHGLLDDQLCHLFEKDLRTLIKEYTVFMKYVKKIRLYANIFFSLMVFTTIVTQFCNVYITLGTSLSNIFKIKQTFFCICVGLYFYIMCHIGKMFDDMGEAIRYEVYNLPWYYMPPRTRRFLNIMQSTVLKHHEFKVFIVYPISMALFPQVMNAVYTYFNFLRTTINRQE